MHLKNKKIFVCFKFTATVEGRW